MASSRLIADKPSCCLQAISKATAQATSGDQTAMAAVEAEAIKSIVAKAIASAQSHSESTGEHQQRLACLFRWSEQAAVSGHDAN